MPCEDEHLAASLRVQNETYLCVTCCDGAGSAAHGGLGARLTSQAVVEETAALVSDGAGHPLRRDGWLHVLGAVLARLKAAANQYECDTSEFATTLLAGVVGPKGASFAQIGDGAVVVADAEGQCSAVIWPQHGEYANVTNFVTSPGALDLLEYVETDSVPTAFAFFTDGLERLILDFGARVVPTGFLGPIWDGLRTTSDTTAFQAALTSFLKSPRVQSRADDDLTLVVGARPIIEAVGA